MWKILNKILSHGNLGEKKYLSHGNCKALNTEDFFIFFLSLILCTNDSESEDRVQAKTLNF